MARFDICPHGDVLVLDVQADSLPYLKTRLVVPLYPVERAPKPLIAILNPTLRFDDGEWAMLTQYAAAAPARHLGATIGSLAAEEYAIGRALEMLLTRI
ncbi:MAG: CcdB family protein [Proteobacteria bacterium]|nr:CcdB family protein [Pseudomonadota bacterium]